MLIQDQEDLINLLQMRFGEIAPEVVTAICTLEDMEQVERLILVAANAPEYRVFLEELEMKDGFKITGERFNPLSK
jgi:hypothetical protein